MELKKFTWVDSYKEIVHWLSGKEDKQEELIKVLQDIGITCSMDMDQQKKRIPLSEIDPFTFLSYLNKFKNKERLRKLQALHKRLNLNVNRPEDVIGLPTIFATKVWLFPFKYERKPDDIKYLWELFRQAIDGNVDNETFKYVLGIKSVGQRKLSIGLFYVNPDMFLSLDSLTSAYLKTYNISSNYSDLGGYLSIIDKVKSAMADSNVEISYKAFDVKPQKTKRVEIKDISDLLKKITIISDDETSDREYIYYRGHSDKNYELRPSIYRGNHIHSEDIMHKEILSKLPNEFSNCKSTFERLVKMQHYGLPTRLLDITSNPLVALFFACKGDKDRDGELLRFSISQEAIKYYDSDTVSIISNISRRPFNFKIIYEERRDENSIEKFNEQPEIAYLLHEIRNEKPHFKPIINIDDIEKVYCVKPKMDNPRIIRQNGAFFLFGVCKKKSNVAKSQFKKTSFIIPKDKKALLLKQLEILGIDESSLFPDIDHTSKQICEKFCHK